MGPGSPIGERGAPRPLTGVDPDIDPERLRDQLRSAIDVLVGDLEMGHCSDDGGMDRGREADSRLAQRGKSSRPLEPERGEVDLDEVCLDLIDVDRTTGFRERLRETSGARVVVGEPVDMVVEGVDARSGDDSRLAHRATEEVLLAPGTLDQLARAGEERAERAAEPLGETERDGVEARGEDRGCDAERGGGVQEPCAVQVHRKPELSGGRDDVFQLGEWPDAAARVVVGVLYRDDRRTLVGELRARGCRGTDLLRRDSSVHPGQAERHETRVSGRASVLVDDDVRRLLGQQYVTRPARELQRDLVCHRRRGHEHRGLLAQELGDPPFELENARILALLLVADRGIRDRASHPGCGLRDGVGAEIDHLEPRRYRPGVDLALLDRALSDRGEPSYRARQVWEWTARGSASYEQMTTLAKPLRAALAAEVPFSTLEAVTEREARDGTVKVLFRTHDGHHPVEAVLMRYRDGRRSLCLSSQSGCPLTCTFCATGAMRFGRNLSVSEILDQALHFRRMEPVNHAVYMGMGEPFLNFQSVLESARRLPDLGITHRRTTISTVGWMPGLRRFVDEVEEPIRLALSIHAADPELRSELMPVNERYPLSDVLAECSRYFELRRRKVFVEYVMLAGVNDSRAAARSLAALLDPRIFKVNLIPYNPTGIDNKGSEYEGSSRQAIESFKVVLNRAGISATVRLTRGRDIEAACGQLAAG